MGLKTSLNYIGRKAAKGILMAAMVISAAMPSFSAMPINEPKDPQTAETLQKVQTDGITEKYNLTSLNITYTNNGDVNFSFRATSQQDNTREDGKKYASASGDKTVMDMEILDDGMGTFGTHKADMRGEILELVYTNPGYSNRANVKIKFNVNKRTSPNMPLYVTNPSAQSDNGSQIVEELILEGKNIAVTINGDRLGNNQHLADAAKRQISPTKKDPNVGSRSFRINWMIDPETKLPTLYRSVYPEDGTVQLPAIRETITPR